MAKLEGEGDNKRFLDEEPKQNANASPGTKRQRRLPSVTTIRDEFTSASLQKAARSIGVGLTKMNVDRLLRGARVIPLTSDGASWVYYLPRWYKRIYLHCLGEKELSLPFGDWFRSVWESHPRHHDTIKMFGRDVLTPRYQQAYGVSYKFSGTMFHAKPWPEVLEHAHSLLQAFVVHPDSGETYLGAGLVNWYAHGDHYLGPHSDDESNIHPLSPIFSLSLGATRRFVFTPRANAPPDVTCHRMELSLEDGDLVIMGGTTQKTHKHAVPKMKSCAGKRVSVTLRCFR